MGSVVEDLLRRVCQASIIRCKTGDEHNAPAGVLDLETKGMGKGVVVIIHEQTPTRSKRKPREVGGFLL